MNNLIENREFIGLYSLFLTGINLDSHSKSPSRWAGNPSVLWGSRFLFLGGIMAQRRMFSKSITNSSRFLMMPQSSQNLYFHFGMNADDDGFCEHFTIMRMTESKPDDLKVLQSKGFVRIFDEKVLVILDWEENNYIRSDRYTASKYLEIYKTEIKELSHGIPDDNQLVDTLATQVRLGKVRLGKEESLPENIDDQIYLEIAEQLYFDIQELVKPPKYEKNKPNIAIWIKSIRQLHKLDKRPIDEIKLVAAWAVRDSFWRANILSGKALRDKYNTLYLQMINSKRKNDVREQTDPQQRIKELKELEGKI